MTRTYPMEALHGEGRPTGKTMENYSNVNFFPYGEISCRFGRRS